MRLCVVIPALSERENLPATMAAARVAFSDARIVVADGGSRDGTREWVIERAARDGGLFLVDAPERGRGPQMNAGAASPAARAADMLLFLHADCLVPADAAARIAAALDADPRTAGGCFRVRFAESRPRSLAVTAWLINAQSRARRAATGDQAIFVRRAAFDALDGYRPWPLFEDIDFVDRLKRRRGRFVVLPGAAVTISARRWLEFGVARTSLWMCALWVGYKCGVPPARLKRWFTDIRPHLTARRPRAG